ncbi:hypothetical protein [Rheinheimera texasensis]|uniref:hypothetical protein n=1 Tax=Rheinheimera texasensis TaxID=306205 RepID=UPI0032B2FCA3
MDSLSVSVFTGVVAGLITSAFLIVLRRIWINTLVPAWEDAVYKDVKIEGRWKASLNLYSVDPTRVRSLISRARASEREKVLAEIEREKVDGGDSKQVNNVKKPSETNHGKDRKVTITRKEPLIDEFILTLKRTGHNIEGTMLCTKGENEGRAYNLKGSLRNLILSGVFESESRSMLERGSISLVLANNGSALVGYLLVYSDDEHVISPMKIECKRES